MVGRQVSRTRRGALVAGGSVVAGIAAMRLFGEEPARAEAFALTLTEAEWRARLAPAAYAVLRGHGTERPWSSPLDAEKRAGRFLCEGCALPLFSSQAKFESGTGWPSFFSALPGAVGTTTDRTLGMSRTEIHCSRCGGHLGHLFADGPPPTGRRYCMNGAALRFVPA